MENFKNDILPMIRFAMFLIVGLVVFVSLDIVAPFVLINSKQCSRYEDQTGRKTEFFIIGGCYVDVGDGVSIPYGEYKARAFTNKGN